MSHQNGSEDEINIPRQPKTKKGRKIIENRKGKIEEDPRLTLFIRGPKSSDNVRLFMNEMHRIKKDFSIVFGRKHDLRPFEDESTLEKYLTQQNCTQFCYLSHSKKRPNNVVIGRTYDGKVLDMIEMGLIDYVSSEQFTKSIDVPMHSRPTLVFQGELFGYNRSFIKIHNILTDFFYENIPINGTENPNLINLIIYVTGVEDKNELHLTMYQRQYAYEDGELKAKLAEVGPRCKFQVRREKYPDEELFKKACRQPKPKKDPNEKNISHDNVGDKRGRIFVQQQDLKTLNIKRRKKIKKGLDKIQENVVNSEKQLQDQNQE